jgi:hypothetical protein
VKNNTAIEFNPKKFLKVRRLELFSDSISIKSPLFTKDEFGYLLHHLASLKKEIEFEHFCRKLVEKEICPNLIPQTGLLEANTHPRCHNTSAVSPSAVSPSAVSDPHISA